MSYLEDSRSRLTVVASHSQAVASLSPGCLEVILDRRSSRDDGRGLEEEVMDTRPMTHSYNILFESRSEEMEISFSFISCQKYCTFPHPQLKYVQITILNSALVILLPCLWSLLKVRHRKINNLWGFFLKSQNSKHNFMPRCLFRLVHLRHYLN